MNAPAPALERFMRYVHPEPMSGCWLWLGATAARGYGKFHLKTTERASPYQSHRASWELLVGPIPEGMCVLHRCDNPACVSPDHLFLGTRADNSQDMWRKGRGLGAERHPMAVLTDVAVAQIKRRIVRGDVLSRIAEDFAVTVSTVSAIKHRKQWRTVVDIEAMEIGDDEQLRFETERGS